MNADNKTVLTAFCIFCSSCQFLEISQQNFELNEEQCFISEN